MPFAWPKVLLTFVICIKRKSKNYPCFIFFISSHTDYFFPFGLPSNRMSVNLVINPCSPPLSVITSFTPTAKLAKPPLCASLLPTFFSLGDCSVLLMDCLECKLLPSLKEREDVYSQTLVLSAFLEKCTRQMWHP